ncbi:MAG: hypothetical protein SNH27_17065 [Rikenellaceae bacterium]
MAKYEYSKYKIIIDPESKKVQGLSVGDRLRAMFNFVKLDGESRRR